MCPACCKRTTESMARSICMMDSLTLAGIQTKAFLNTFWCAMQSLTSSRNSAWCLREAFAPERLLSLSMTKRMLQALSAKTSI